MALTKNHEPNADWIIIVITTLNLDHEIFGKSYRPTIERDIGGPDGGVLINNSDGFLTALPILTRKSDFKIKAVSYLLKEDRLTSKLARE